MRNEKINMEDLCADASGPDRPLHYNCCLPAWEETKGYEED